MSGTVRVRVRHHVYGSTPRGFATIVEPHGGVSREELIQLERRCGYALPARLSSDAGDAPVKHTCFEAAQSLVIGRSVYLGVDLTGRRGNYVTHNLLFDKSETCAYFDGPAALIDAVERAGVFRDAGAPDEAAALPDQVELEASNVPANPDVTDEAVQALVTLLASWDPNSAPAAIIGTDERVRAAMAAAFGVVPHAIRWRLPFDTYIVGGDWKGLAAVALPESRDYPAAVSACAVLIDLTEGRVDWKRSVHESALVPHLMRLRHAPVRLRSSFFAVIDLFEAGCFEAVREDVAILDPQSLSVLFPRYRTQLIDYFGRSGDVALLSEFAADVTAADLEQIARSEAFVNVAAAPEWNARVIGGAIEMGPRSTLASWVARTPNLLFFFLRDSLDRLGPQSSVPLLAAFLPHLTGDDRIQDEEFVLLALRAARGARAVDCGAVVSAIRRLPGANATRTAWRLCTAAAYTDRDALATLLGSRDLLSAVLAVAPAAVERPDVMVWMLRNAVAAGMDVDRAVSAIVAMTDDGSLAAQRVVDASRYLLAETSGLDEKQRRCFARSLQSAIKGSPAAEWAAELEELVRKEPGGFIRFARRTP